MFADSPIKTWQSKLKSPYTPEVDGAVAEIASRVKLSERPSGFHDKLQRIGSLSISAAGDFKIGHLNNCLRCVNSSIMLRVV